MHRTPPFLWIGEVVSSCRVLLVTVPPYRTKCIYIAFLEKKTKKKGIFWKHSFGAKKIFEGENLIYVILQLE